MKGKNRQISGIIRVVGRRSWMQCPHPKRSHLGFKLPKYRVLERKFEISTRTCMENVIFYDSKVSAAYFLTTNLETNSYNQKLKMGDKISLSILNRN